MTRMNDVYAYLYDEMEAARRQMNEYEDWAMTARRKMTHLSGMLVLFRDKTCMNCHGKGEVWTSYAQGDTKFVKCQQCNGTGERVTGHDEGQQR